jgi:hypothetical protein
LNFHLLTRPDVLFPVILLFFPFPSKAVVLAPFFTFIEVLFFLGWRPKLKRAIEHASSKKIVELDRARSIRQSAAREQGKKMEEERRKRWEEITMQNKDSLGAVEREEIRQKMKEGKGGKVE